MPTAALVWAAALVLFILAIVGVERARRNGGSPIGSLLALVASFWLGGLGVGLAIAAAVQ